jgi:hypothetical protein
VYLREYDLVTPLDRALAAAFTPARIEDTITRLTDSQNQPPQTTFWPSRQEPGSRHATRS